MKGGIIGFLYLEVLDASFSFDGVIGAFAITNDVIVIMLGLAIGVHLLNLLTLPFVASLARLKLRASPSTSLPDKVTTTL